MNLKKILPILLLLVVVLSISSVAAADFADLQKDIDATEDGETLYLNQDYIAGTNDNIILINKTITIDGLSITGKTTHSITLQNGPSAMFALVNGGNLTLKNVKINVANGKNLFFTDATVTTFPAEAVFDNVEVTGKVTLDKAIITGSEFINDLTVKDAAVISDSKFASLFGGDLLIFNSNVTGILEFNETTQLQNATIGTLAVDATGVVAVDTTFKTVDLAIKATFDNVTVTEGDVVLLNDSSLMNSKIVDGDVNVTGTGIVLFNNTLTNGKQITVFENCTIISKVVVILKDNATFFQNMYTEDGLIPVDKFVDDNNNTVWFKSAFLDIILTVGDTENVLVYKDGSVNGFALKNESFVLAVDGNFTADDLSASSGNFKNLAISFKNGWVYVEPDNTIAWLNKYIELKVAAGVNEITIPTGIYYATEKLDILDLNDVESFNGNNSVIDFLGIGIGISADENLNTITNAVFTNVNGTFVNFTATDVTLENVTINNVNGTGIVASNLTLKNVEIANANIGIELDSIASFDKVTMTNNVVDFKAKSNAFDRVIVEINDQTALAYQKVNVTAIAWAVVNGKYYSLEATDLALKTNDTDVIVGDIAWKDGIAYGEVDADKLGTFTVKVTEAGIIKDDDTFDGTLTIGKNTAVAEMERTGVNEGTPVTELVIINGTDNTFKFVFKDAEGNVLKIPNEYIYYAVDGGKQNSYNGVITIAEDEYPGKDLTYTVNVIGDPLVTVAPATFTLKAVKAQPNIAVEVADQSVGNALKVIVTNNGDKEAVVVDIYVNDVLAHKGLTVPKEGSKFALVSDGLIAGENNVTVVSTSDNFYPVEIVTPKNFTAPTITLIDIDDVIVIGEDGIIIKGTVISTYGPVNGNVTIKFDDETTGKQVKLENGAFEYTWKGALGQHYVEVTYNGVDDTFETSTDLVKFTVINKTKAPSEVVITVDVDGYTADIYVAVVGEEGVVPTGKVDIAIGGKLYTYELVDGVAPTVELTDLDQGEYTVEVVYAGDDNYLPSYANETFFVAPTLEIVMDDLVKIWGADDRLVATLLKDGEGVANATIVFTINGKEYNKTTDENGVASIGINLVAGVYDVSAAYLSQQEAFADATVTVISTIVAEDVEMFYQDGTGVIATFTNSNGDVLANTEVKFNINGVWYTKVTDENGVATLKLNLLPDTYICTAVNPVTGEERGINVNIKPLIVAEDLVKVYGEAAAFTATFYNKDGSLAVGKDACFNINGVFYYRTVDANGQAKLNINLLPGEYTITSFLGTPEDFIAFAGNTVTVKAA